MRLYVYCLSDELAGDASGWPEGLGGARVRLAEFGGVRAAVSEFGGERAPVTRDSLHAHNRVNAHALARVTPLPFRFGTLADEARLAEYVESNGAALLAALARVRGCFEMGLKVRLGGGVSAGAEESDFKIDGAGATAGADAGLEEDAAGEGVGRGTAFLLAKRREILGGEGLKARAEELAARLDEFVGSFVRESDVRVSPEAPVALRVAHLVARADLEDYRARVRAFNASARGIQTLGSGPWPPYSFSNLSPV